jgi:hypothetical protein
VIVLVLIDDSISWFLKLKERREREDIAELQFTRVSQPDVSQTECINRSPNAPAGTIITFANIIRIIFLSRIARFSEPDAKQMGRRRFIGDIVQY